MQFATLVPFFALLVLTFANPEAFPLPETSSLVAAEPRNLTSYGEDTTGAQLEKRLRHFRRCSICGARCICYMGHNRCAVHFYLGNICVQQIEDQHGHNNFPRAETTLVVRASGESGLSSAHDLCSRLQKREKRITRGGWCQICRGPCLFSEQGVLVCPQHLHENEICVEEVVDGPRHRHHPRAETTSSISARVRSELPLIHDQSIWLAKRLTPIRWCIICGTRCGVYLTTMVCPVHYEEMGNTCEEARRLHPRLALDAPDMTLSAIAETLASRNRELAFQERVLTPWCEVCIWQCVRDTNDSFRCPRHGRTCVFAPAFAASKRPSLDFSLPKNASHHLDHPEDATGNRGMKLQKRYELHRCRICRRVCTIAYYITDHYRCAQHGRTCTDSMAAETSQRRGIEHSLLEHASYHPDFIKGANGEREVGLQKRSQPPWCEICSRRCVFVANHSFRCPIHGRTCVLPRIIGLSKLPSFELSLPAHASRHIDPLKNANGNRKAGLQKRLERVPRCRICGRICDRVYVALFLCSEHGEEVCAFPKTVEPRKLPNLELSLPKHTDHPLNSLKDASDDHRVKLQKRSVPAPRCLICGRICFYVDDLADTFQCPDHGRSCAVPDPDGALKRPSLKLSLPKPTSHPLKSLNGASDARSVKLQKRLQRPPRCRLCSRICIYIGIYAGIFRCPDHGLICVIPHEARASKQPRLELPPLEHISHHLDPPESVHGDRGIKPQKRSVPALRCAICNQKCRWAPGDMGNSMCPEHGAACRVVDVDALDHTRSADRKLSPSFDAGYHLDAIQGAHSAHGAEILKRANPARRCIFCQRDCVLEDGPRNAHKCLQHGFTCAPKGVV